MEPSADLEHTHMDFDGPALSMNGLRFDEEDGFWYSEHDGEEVEVDEDNSGDPVILPDVDLDGERTIASELAIQDVMMYMYKVYNAINPI